MKLMDLFEHFDKTNVLLEENLNDVKALWSNIFSEFEKNLAGLESYTCKFREEKLSLFNKLYVEVNALSESDKVEFILSGNVGKTYHGYSKEFNIDKYRVYDWASCTTRYTMIKKITPELQLAIFNRIGFNGIEILKNSDIVMTGRTKIFEQNTALGTLLTPIYAQRRTTIPIFPIVQQAMAQYGDRAYSALYSTYGFYYKHSTAIPDQEAIKITINSLKKEKRYEDMNLIDRQINELKSIWKNVLNGKIKSPDVSNAVNDQKINVEQMVAAVTADWKSLADCFEALPINNQMPTSVIIAALNNSLETIEIIEEYDPEILKRQEIQFVISDIKHTQGQ